VTIPVIDLRADRGEVMRGIDEAYGTLGFATLVGHGVPEPVTKALFAASAAFHAMPLDRKSAVELDVNHRGYIPVAVSTDRTSSVEPATDPNLSASFMMMREDMRDSAEVAAGTYLAGPNRWPALPGFRPAVEAYHDAMLAVGERLVDLVAELLGDTDGVLRGAFSTPTTWLRLLCYPPQGAAHSGFGSAPHRDFGCITLLAQDDVGGLEVLTPGGDWIQVAPQPGALVMNVGDMLHRWSNGRLLSTPHRVVGRRQERFSAAFFFDPHMSTVVEPLPSCVDDDQPAAFAPIEFGTFVRGQLESTYDHHAR